MTNEEKVVIEETTEQEQPQKKGTVQKILVWIFLTIFGGLIAGMILFSIFNDGGARVVVPEKNEHYTVEKQLVETQKVTCNPLYVTSVKNANIQLEPVVMYRVQEDSVSQTLVKQKFGFKVESIRLYIETKVANTIFSMIPGGSSEEFIFAQLPLIADTLNKQFAEVGITMEELFVNVTNRSLDQRFQNQ